MKRRGIGGAVVALALGGALAVAFSPGARGVLDAMRREFVAWQYVSQAMASVTQRPLDRAFVARRMSRALELAPDEPGITALAPEVYIAAGAYEKALPLLARQKEPDAYQLALCLLKLGDTSRGARILLASIEQATVLHRRKAISDGQYALQMNNAGYLLADAGVELARARSLLETAAALLPLDANCVDSLGWVHYRLGNTRKAVFLLERAVRLQPGRGEPDIHYHLGAAYARQGKVARATRQLRIALRLDPSHREARNEMRTIRWVLPQPTLARAPAPGRPA